MVEAGAKEISEAEILDALDIAHAEIKKICALQRDLAARVGKEKTPVETPGVDEALLEEIRGSHGEALDDATQVVDKLERQDATTAVEEAVMAQYAPAPSPTASAEEVEEAVTARLPCGSPSSRSRRRSSASASRSTSGAPTAAGADEIRDISIEVGVARARTARRSSRAARRRPQSLVTLGTAKRGAADRRRSALRDEEALHATTTTSRPSPSGEAGPLAARAARHRPRRARRAGAGADDARHRRVPLHDPRRLRDARVQRLLLDGVGLRLHALADGRRRADQRARRGDRDGADQGGRRLRRAHRHRGRRGPPRRHGLQGRRHRRAGSPRSRWTSRSPASRATILREALEPGARGAHGDPRQDGRRHRQPRQELAASRRGSRRSRSTRARSAC